jgi:inorganic phosphate transporter, PiT family
MLTSSTAMVVFFVAVALLFDFLNGFHDSSNIVATMISSRALSPKRALVIAALCEFLGPFLFGVAVATTIGQQIVAEDIMTMKVILAALVSAIGWNVATWWLGIPSSSSHALIGGLVGSACMSKLIALVGQHGFAALADVASIVAAVKPPGVVKVVLTLLISPPLGFVAGYLFHLLLRFSAGSPRRRSTGTSRRGSSSPPSASRSPTARTTPRRRWGSSPWPSSSRG